MRSLASLISPRLPVVLRTAVIGCGTISHQHLGFLAESPLVNLVAVCDQSPATAKYAARRYQAGTWSLDAEELLRTTQVDVVHVLTPPHTHDKLITAALDSGAHVICEKPLAPSAETAARLLDHARSQGRALIESHNLLFNDPTIWVDELVEKGQLGEVREVDITLSLDLTAGSFGDPNLSGPGVALPGGAVHDFLPHLSYLFLHFANHLGPVDSVCGDLRNESGNPRVGFDHLDALVRAGHIRGRLRVASDLAPDSFRLTVQGTKGRAETDFYNPYLRFEGGKNVGKRAPLEQFVTGSRLTAAAFINFTNKVRQHGTYHGIPRMLHAVYQALIDGQGLPITAAEILATAQLNDRLVSLASAESGAFQ